MAPNLKIFVYLCLRYSLFSNAAKSSVSISNFNLSVNTSLSDKFESTFPKTDKHCAVLADSPYLHPNFKHNLYPASEIDQNDYYEDLRTGLRIAYHSVGTEYTEPCIMEICGYFTTLTGSEASCRQFNRTNPGQMVVIINPPSYFATSLRCGCNDPGITNCTKETCDLQEESITWGSNDCAIMYEEPNCQSCYFSPTRISNNTLLETRNSHEIKSVIVKSGCHVEKSTYGYMEQDYDLPEITNLTGIVTEISPSYHVRSANFTCLCDSDDGDESTTENYSESTTENYSESTTENYSDSTTENGVESTTKEAYISTTEDYEGEINDTTWKIYLGVGIGVIIIFCILVLLVVQRKRGKQSTKIYKRHTLPTTTDQNTNYSSDHQLKNEILGEVEQKIETFLKTVFGPISNFPPHRQSSPYESDESVLDNELSKISRESRILSSTAFSINLKNPLGSGHFSTVYKGVLTVDGVNKTVAVKKIKREGDRENWLFKSFLHEVQTFEIIDNGSVFIVNYFGACCHTDGLYLLTELCERGSLRTFLMESIRPKYEGSTMEIDKMKDFGDNYYSDETVMEALEQADFLRLLTWCQHITSGMEYLHSKRIIHGDLAVRNVLLADNLCAKICDFGLSRRCTNKEYYEVSLNKGDFPFNSLAPECIMDDGTDVQKIPLSIDIWAFGCTLWEIFSLGNKLYSDVEGQGILKFVAVRERVLNGVPQPKPVLASDMIYEQMLGCWSKIPDDRPSFKALRIHFEKCVFKF